MDAARARAANLGVRAGMAVTLELTTSTVVAVGCCRNVGRQEREGERPVSLYTAFYTQFAGVPAYQDHLGRAFQGQHAPGAIPAWRVGLL